MVENLRLIGPFQPDKSDSDVTWSKGSGTFTLTASYSGAWCTEQSAACYNQSMVLDSGDSNYGAYYNWYAATAGTGTYSVSSGNATSSICSKGWRLPTGDSNGEFEQLYRKYNSLNLMLGTPNFVLAGYRFGYTTHDVGIKGEYYSSSAGGNELASTLIFENGAVHTHWGNYNRTGHNVRCLAR